MPERNAKQAWLIPSAEALPNPVGTAPGWWVERDGKVTYLLTIVDHQRRPSDARWVQLTPGS